MAVVGVASIRIKPDLTEFRKELNADLKSINSTLNVAVHADTKLAQAEIDAFVKRESGKTISKKVEADSGSITKFGKALDGLTGPLLNVGKASLGFVAVQSAAQAIVPLLIAASGAALLLPGAIAAAGIAAGTLKLGAAGIKQAFTALTPTLNTLKKQVSDTFVTGLAPAVRDLKVLIPQLTPGFKAVAGAISTVAQQFTEMLKSNANVSILKGLLTSTAIIIRNVGAALAPVVQAFLTIAGVAAGTLGDLTSGFGAAAQRFADFITAAGKGPQLFDWIQGGLSALKTLGAIVVQIGGIIAAVFNGLSQGAGDLGGSFLPVLKAINVALSSGAGAAALQALGRAMSQLGQAAGGALLSAFQILLPLITGVLNFIGDHATLVVNLAIAAIALGKGIAIASAAMEAFTAIMAIFDGVADANPIGVIVLAIAALVAIAAVVIANWGPISAFFQKIGSAIASAFHAAIDWVSNAFQNTVSAITGFFSGIGKFFSNVGDGIVSGFDAAISFLQGLPAKIGSFLASLPGIIGNALLAAMKFGLNAIVQGVEWILAELIALPFQIGFLLVKLGSILVNAFTTAWNAVIAWLPGAITTVIVFFQDLPGNIMNALANFGSLLLGWITGAWNGLTSFVSGAFSAMVAFFQALPGQIISGISSFGTGIVNWFKSAWTNLVNATADALPGILNFFNSLPGKILGALGDFGNMLLNAGKAIIQGLVNGIKAGAKWVTDALGDILAKARSLLPFSPARTGPFSGKGWTLYSGMSISQALADGIAKNGGKAVQATEDMMNGIASVSNPALGASLAGQFQSQIKASGAVDFTPTPVVVNVATNPEGISDFINVHIQGNNRTLVRGAKAGVGGTTTA